MPLEAQRLGLESYASDLNPVAVLICKAMIEIPPKFAGKPPVNPESRKKIGSQTGWKGAQGLAEDVRYYGKWMRDEAEKRIGHLYPKIEITATMANERPELKPYVGKKLTVIAWLWARTVKSPNPAFTQVDVPLVSTFMLSTKVGKETYVEPVIDNSGYRFTVKVGKPRDVEAAKNGTKLSRGANFRCLMSGVPIEEKYIKAESKAGRMGMRLMAIVLEGERERVYMAPTLEHEVVAQNAHPVWKPDQQMNRDTRDLVSGRGYGFFIWADLFTPRQLLALTTFSDLVQDARTRVEGETQAISMSNGDQGPTAGSRWASDYADGVAVYLAFAVSRMVNYSATLCVWSSHPKDELAKQVFLRQALPMTWDFAETNPFSSAGGTLDINIQYLTKAINMLPGVGIGNAYQADATQVDVHSSVVSTDPPYYDNVAYADLSDFFYIWLRRSLRQIYQDLFATVAVPKAEELVATTYRHGSKEKAETFFLDGMSQAMHRIAERAHPAFPVTIYYAFKQSEDDTDAGTVSTGWETFLGAVIGAGFAVSGTWPIRTELVGNLKKNVTALASSIVLVCRSRASDALTATRREFVTALKTELPQALAYLQAATSRQSTSRRQQSAQAWQSTLATIKFSTPKASLFPCAKRSRSSTRPSTSRWPSKKATSMPTPAGR